jgi:hypothetical protein
MSMTTSFLLNEDGVAVSPLPGMLLEARVRARVLLDHGGLAGAEIEMCEAVLGEETLFVDRFESIRDLYERREREANLNGCGWEGGGL